MTEPAPCTPPTLAPELRDQLPRLIAHALRTPLGLVNAALQELEASAGEEPLLVLGQRGAQQLARLADRLSLLARIDREDQGTPSPVDLVPLIDRAMEEIARVRPRRRVQTTRGPMPARALVSGRADHLQAILAELVDNSVRFAKRSVEVRARLHEGGVTVEFHDDGPGPTAVTQAETDFGRGGLGIGLHLVRCVVAGHGGRFELRDGDAGGGLSLLTLETTESIRHTVR